MQLRFASFAVINLRRDLHPQECAHAGRTQKNPNRIRVGILNTGGGWLTRSKLAHFSSLTCADWQGAAGDGVRRSPVGETPCCMMSTNPVSMRQMGCDYVAGAGLPVLRESFCFLGAKTLRALGITIVANSTHLASQPPLPAIGSSLLGLC